VSTGGIISGGGLESNLNCQPGRNASLLTAAHLEVPGDARRWTALIGRDYFLIRGSIRGSRSGVDTNKWPTGSGRRNDRAHQTGQSERY